MLQFPCLRLSFEALQAGQGACIALNAANEVAVAAFLEGRVSYTHIARMIERTLDWHAGLASIPLNSLDDVVAADELARAYANTCALKML
jgi:1-deoxy-D-xylulose-5-phosphate reductoisomerase